MIYSKSIAIPANTFLAAYQTDLMLVTKGLVYKVEFDFPPGHAGLTFVRVRDGLHQVWPTTSDQWFSGEGQTISFDDTHLKLSPPFEFSIDTYNLDDTFDHTVTVRVGLVSSEVFMARFLPTYTFKYFKAMLMELQWEQELRFQAIIDNPISYPKRGD